MFKIEIIEKAKQIIKSAEQAITKHIAGAAQSGLHFGEMPYGPGHYHIRILLTK